MLIIMLMVCSSLLSFLYSGYAAEVLLKVNIVECYRSEGNKGEAWIYSCSATKRVRSKNKPIGDWSNVGGINLLVSIKRSSERNSS